MAAAAAGTKQQIAFYGSTPAYRRRARAPRLGRPPDRAQPPVQAGRVGGDGRADRRRHPRRLRRRRPSRTRSPPRCSSASATSSTAQLLPPVPADDDRWAPCSPASTGRRSDVTARLGPAAGRRRGSGPAQRALQLARRVFGRLPGATSTTPRRAGRRRRAPGRRRRRRSSVRRRSALVSATTTIALLPWRRSTPKAMTLPARTPSTSADGPLDVLGEDVAAADDDHVLEPAADDQLAVDQVAQVAGAQPAVVEGRGGGLGPLVVAGGHARCPGSRARPTSRSAIDVARLGIDDPDLQAGRRRGRAWPAGGRRRRRRSAGRGVALGLEDSAGRPTSTRMPLTGRGTCRRWRPRPSRRRGTPRRGRAPGGAPASTNASTVAGSTGSAPLRAMRQRRQVEARRSGRRARAARA